MVSHRRHASASPEVAWGLLARPAMWSTWAPHLRGAWGLGDPEVEAGRRGAVRLGGVVPIPVRITAKEPGRSWTWKAGPYLMEHRVEPVGAGCDVVIDVTASPVLERALAATYGPVIGFLLGRLAAAATEVDAQLSEKSRRCAAGKGRG